MYSISFTENNKRICLSLYFNGANSYLFVNGKEIYKFKAKDSEIVLNILCLGNISKKVLADYMKKKNRIKWLCTISVLIMWQFLLLYHTFINIWWLKME